MPGTGPGPRVGDRPVGAADVGRAYDERSPIGERFRDGQLHMWYWYDDADDASLAEAVRRISRRVTGSLGLRAGERVLDAGCGPGATAVELARNFRVRVTGVTVSEVELARAAERASRAGVAELVRFQYADFADLPFPDRSFDAVLALESLMYAADLDRVLRELFRVLRPGGRISLSDFSLESPDEPDRIAAFMSALRMNVLPTLPEWLDRLAGAGFEVEEFTQCGPRVFGRKGKYLTAAMALREEVAAAFGEPAVAEYARSHQGFFAPRKRQIGYVIVSARKPFRLPDRPAASEKH